MSTIRCPTCDASFDSEHSTAMPFCSNRCRLIDLGMWLDERMGLPYDRDPDEEGEDGGEIDRW